MANSRIQIYANYGVVLKGELHQLEQAGREIEDILERYDLILVYQKISASKLYIVENESQEPHASE